jgi:phage terminase small subunit
MDAKAIANISRKYKGVRVFPTPPTNLGKQGKEEWNRLVNSLHITEKDIGSLTMACQNYQMYIELYEVITTEKYTDVSGKIRKRKISVAEYCEGKNSQNQIILTNMNKAFLAYEKTIKRLTENNALTGMEEKETEETYSANDYELIEQLL